MVLRVLVFVIGVARARQQAGGAPFFCVGKLHFAMQAFVRCRFAYFTSRTCAHVSTMEVRPFLPRLEFALCSAADGVMTRANKQTQCFFGPTLTSVLAQSENAGERLVRNSATRPGGTYIYAYNKTLHIFDLTAEAYLNIFCDLNL